MFLDDDFFDAMGEALQETLRVDKHLKREMIQFLMDEGFWDKDMKWASAVARFDACLNPTKAEYFKISELCALMKRFDRHHLFLAMGKLLGYDMRRMATIERVQSLLEDILEKLNDREDKTASLRNLVEGALAGNIEQLIPSADRRGKFSRAERAEHAP